MIKSISVLGLLLFFCSAYGQGIEKWTFSSFSSITVNDSLNIVAGQVVSGEESDPKVYHGYYPLMHSLLTVDENDNPEIKIFPNPFESSITLSGENIPDGAIVRINSIDGKEFLRFEFEENSIIQNLDFMESGMYILSIEQANSVLFIEKLVKQ